MTAQARPQGIANPMEDFMHHFTIAKLVCVYVCLCFKRRSDNRWFAIDCSTIAHHDAVVLPALPATVNLDPTQSVKSGVLSHRRWHSVDQSCHNFITMMAAIH